MSISQKLMSIGGGDSYWIAETNVGGSKSRIAIDADDNIVFRGEQQSNFYVSKLDTDGNALWGKWTTASTFSDYGNGIDIDTNGDNWNLCFNYYNSIFSGHVAKLSPLDGSTLNQEIRYRSPAASLTPRFLICGTFGVAYAIFSGGGYGNPVIIKYNNDFSVQWRKNYEVLMNGYVYGGAVDSSGNLTLVMQVSSNNHVRIFKINSSGTVLWFKDCAAFGLGTTTTIWNTGALDSNNKFFFTGSYNNEAYLLKNDAANGNGLLAKKLTHGTSPYLISRGVAVDSNNDVYHLCVGSIGSRDVAYIVKLDNSGTLQWVNVFKTTANTLDVSPYDVKVDSNDNIIIACAYSTNKTIILKLPNDGSKTGVYGSFTYASDSVTVSNFSTTFSDVTFTVSDTTEPLAATAPAINNSGLTSTVYPA